MVLIRILRIWLIILELLHLRHLQWQIFVASFSGQSWSIQQTLIECFISIISAELILVVIIILFLATNGSIVVFAFVFRLVLFMVTIILFLAGLVRTMYRAARLRIRISHHFLTIRTAFIIEDKLKVLLFLSALFLVVIWHFILFVFIHQTALRYLLLNL